ncbi:MAG TPA: type II toxin-antitoxin system VapC family toxin [Acidobacteriota bacterium]
MAIIVADTDVLIDFLAGRGPAAERVASALQQNKLVTTTVSRFELLCGARSQRQTRLVRDLLEALPVLLLDVPAADRAAAVHRALEQQGKTVGMADSLIAGIVLSHEAELLTGNRRHFERVEGLTLAELAR